ncbi:phosphoribosylaminoimidazolesuccinocarboxamide synthase [Labilithrix luteola]|uniref:phosphoribosylaminoimidazolesuccinocarboxamide synthase n=1 Tax=Labilithrix luteola TaxID=1391654 RepID=UPI000A80CF6E|nr:phosphoribosylaminoimidazolesuccinocarboxamide synthase [Labilithrix luteola]
MVDDELLKAQLGQTLERTSFEGLGTKYEGKVRDNYSRGDRRFIVVTDRISAFDRILGTIPFKGQVLNQLAAWWFEKTKDVAKSHYIGTPDPNVLECVECKPLPVEMVVRAYITGSTSTSMWTHYQEGKRTFCGHALPEGLVKNQKLERAILTPATKAPLGEHDISASREEILARGEITADDFDRAAEMVMKLFAVGQKLCAERGLILVDTKYELGKTASGEIVLIDEIHTPDSSRYWMANTYDERFTAGLDPEPLDKDFVRRYYTALGYRGDGEPAPLPPEVRVGAAKRYIEAYERVTGETFQPNVDDPLPRIAKNLGLS